MLALPAASCAQTWPSTLSQPIPERSVYLPLENISRLMYIRLKGWLYRICIAHSALAFCARVQLC